MKRLGGASRWPAVLLSPDARGRSRARCGHRVRGGEFVVICAHGGAGGCVGENFEPCAHFSGFTGGQALPRSGLPPGVCGEWM